MRELAKLQGVLRLWTTGEGIGIEPIETNGEPGWNRTINLLIKSQLLCQLSYGPERGGTITSLANAAL